MTANGCRVLFWDDENVLKLDWGDVNFVNIHKH